MEEIVKQLKTKKSFYEWLTYVRDTEGLSLVHDNGWFWLEYNEEIVKGSGQELFTSSSEMNVLLKLAGL